MPTKTYEAENPSNLRPEPVEYWIAKRRQEREPEPEPEPESKIIKAYSVVLFVSKDDNGIWSAVAPGLPGAGSCGDTEAQAIENAKEAIAGVLECYDSDADIPWKTIPALPSDTKQLKTIVHV
jgi:predicted RNase H-like HicB family nuclease